MLRNCTVLKLKHILSINFNTLKLCIDSLLWNLFENKKKAVGLLSFCRSIISCSFLAIWAFGALSLILLLVWPENLRLCNLMCNRNVCVLAARTLQVPSQIPFCHHIDAEQMVSIFLFTMKCMEVWKLALWFCFWIDANFWVGNRAHYTFDLFGRGSNSSNITKNM